MLTSLSINNFALIDKLGIDFSDGFSIITGETGAGKSILLGALGLVLGKRADLTSLKNKDEKCLIEAHFKISNYNLQSFFADNDLDYETETIIRREILPSGKSRAFINDSPVNLQELQKLSLFLIDIHSQHQTQELSEEGFQLKIIDSVASNFDNIASYSAVLKSYKNDKSQFLILNNQLHSVLKEQDYNTFLLEELLEAKLKLNNQEELEIIYQQLNNVEFIKESLDKSLALANEEQFGIQQNFRELKFALYKTVGFSQGCKSLLDRINSVSIEFDDIASELNQLSENLINDPAQLDLVGQKLQIIYNLQKKHQVSSVAELIEIQYDLDNKVVSVSELEIEIAKLSDRIKNATLELDYFSSIIRDNRLRAVPILSEKLIFILNQLGMPNVRFSIEIKSSETYFSNGKDELQFLFSANKGSDFGLLKKVASGGELSRIMLATKSILAQYSDLPTIIFDEIDTGVSGEIANKMGNIMKDMSSKMQVLSITHLPQIAAKGNAHYKVFKSTKGDYTISELKLLSDEERIIEIAEMLSGKDITDSAIIHAKALLG